MNRTQIRRPEWKLGDLTFNVGEEARRLEEVINFTSGSQFLFFLKTQSLTQKPQVEGVYSSRLLPLMLAAARRAELAATGTMGRPQAPRESQASLLVSSVQEFRRKQEINANAS